MFRPMRRKKQQLSESECERILREVSYGVLSFESAEGYPYGVPMNHVYMDGKLCFHGAASGLRFDSVGEGCRACFTVVEKWEVDAPSLSTLYRSVIAYGRLRRAESGEETEEAAFALGRRFLDDAEAVRTEVEREKKALCCYILEIEHLSGKEGRLLSEQRRENHD